MEELEKVEKLEKLIYEIKEMLKKKPINIQFVDEKIVIDVKYVDAGAERRMLIDGGAPKSSVS